MTQISVAQFRARISLSIHNHPINELFSTLKKTSMLADNFS